MPTGFSLPVRLSATYRDLAVRYLTASNHLDHDTICKFRRANVVDVSKAFVDVLELDTNLELLKLGKVSLDGTHIKASASIHQNETYGRASELREHLKLDVKELMEQADGSDEAK